MAPSNTTYLISFIDTTYFANMNHRARSKKRRKASREQLSNEFLLLLRSDEVLYEL